MKRISVLLTLCALAVLVFILAGGVWDVGRLVCDVQGGLYSRQGLAGAYMCVRQHKDGGKICKSNKDCEGSCVQSSDATFVCTYTDSPFGCYCNIDDYIPSSNECRTLCTD